MIYSLLINSTDAPSSSFHFTPDAAALYLISTYKRQPTKLTRFFFSIRQDEHSAGRRRRDCDGDGTIALGDTEILLIFHFPFSSHSI